MKKSLTTAITMLIIALSVDIALIDAKTTPPSKHKTNKTTAKGASKPTITTQCQSVDIKSLLKTPDKYVGKLVCFNAKFDAFNELALDYPPVMRSRKEYISLTVYRPETDIPLSELKLVYPLKKAQNEKLADLKRNTTVSISGTVSATALDEPWIDVSELRAK